MKMENPGKAYLEHIAFRVKDIHWHISFFREVLGMAVRETDGEAAHPKQVWTLGGLQMIADPAFEGPEGRFAHLGVMCEDAEEAITRGLAWPGVTHLPQGRNWLLLPDGLVVELLQAKPPQAVRAALAVNPRHSTATTGVAAPAKQPHELYFDEVTTGDEGATPEVTVTREMIRAYADLSSDHTPIHVDEEFATASHFGGIVAHGLFGLALADGLKTQGTLQFPPGASLGWNWDFLKPIHAGDRLRVRYWISAMRPTKKPEWGIVIVAGELLNQKDEIVQKGEHKVMILRRPGSDSEFQA